MKISAIPSFKSLDLVVNKQTSKDYVMETIYQHLFIKNIKYVFHIDTSYMILETLKN
jgi:hypothetical protein